MTLLTGCNHVALVTDDIDRFVAFYTAVFDAELRWDLTEGPVRHVMLDMGGGFALHPFQLAEGSAYGKGSPEMFDRGHLDHLALDVADEETFETLRRRLVEHGASDGTVTDFGVTRNVWFADPDGHGCEIAMWTGGAPLTFDDRIVEEYTPAAGAPAGAPA